MLTQIQGKLVFLTIEVFYHYENVVSIPHTCSDRSLWVSAGWA